MHILDKVIILKVNLYIWIYESDPHYYWHYEM